MSGLTCPLTLSISATSESLLSVVLAPTISKIIMLNYVYYIASHQETNFFLEAYIISVLNKIHI